jgi:hypothetical protein
LFFTVGIDISGGSNSKKHLLSPLQHRLSLLLTCIYGSESSSIIKSSFHSHNSLNFYQSKKMHNYKEKGLEEKVFDFIKSSESLKNKINQTSDIEISEILSFNTEEDSKENKSINNSTDDSDIKNNLIKNDQKNNNSLSNSTLITKNFDIENKKFHTSAYLSNSKSLNDISIHPPSIVKPKKNSIIFNYIDLIKPTVDDIRFYSVDSNNIFIKNKIKFLTFSVAYLNFVDFKDSLLNLNYIKNDKSYAYLIKIRKEDGNFAMANAHDIWKSENFNTENIYKLYLDICNKIENFIDEYSNEEIDIIQLMIIEVNPLPKLKINNINKLTLDKNIIKIGDTKNNFNNRNLPLTMNLKYFGQKLNYNINSKGYIDLIDFKGINIFENIVYDKDDTEMKLGSKIILNKITSDIKINIFLNSRYYKPRLGLIEKGLVLKLKIFIVENINEIRNIEVFDISNCVEISSDKTVIINRTRFGKPEMIVKDKSLNTDKTEFIRTIKDFSLHIKNSKIIKFEKNIDLPVIQYKDYSSDKFARNSNIGVLDIETYFNKDLDKAFSYAIGYKIFNRETKLFYIKDNQSSEDLILECINSLLKPTYDGFIFYVHNLHGFDSFFILKTLLNYNYNNDNYYKIDTVFRDNRIIKLTISIKISNHTQRKISLHDSYLIIPSSLSKLAKDFDCNNQKGYFPYKFVNNNNLNYIGKTPDKNYFNNISDYEYNEILSDK